MGLMCQSTDARASHDRRDWGSSVTIGSWQRENRMTIPECWRGAVTPTTENDMPKTPPRLSSQAVSFWTDVVAQSAKAVDAAACLDNRTAGRPCATGPWRLALEDHLKNRPSDTTPRLERASEIAGLITLSKDIAQPGWPDPRRDLIDFALTYLEADVMLFRSGYTKKNLIRRVQQSPLTREDTARVDAVLRRAVMDGTGLEEFRAYCRLAGHMVAHDHLPDLANWLEEAAIGAVVDRVDLHQPYWRPLPSPHELSKQDHARLDELSFWRGGYKWGLIYPQLRVLKKIEPAARTPTDKTRRNAFRMLAWIKRRLGVPVWQPINQGVPSGADIG